MTKKLSAIFHPHIEKLLRKNGAYEFEVRKVKYSMFYNGNVLCLWITMFGYFRVGDVNDTVSMNWASTQTCASRK